MRPISVWFLILCVGAVFPHASAQQTAPATEDSAFSKAFVAQAQVVSKAATEKYAHQSSLRIVHGKGYAVYQCNETTPEENKAGQIARMAIFEIANPTATAKWVDVSTAGDSLGGLKIGKRVVSAPMLHSLGKDQLRIFFTASLESDPGPAFRVFFKDYTISTGALSELHAVLCIIGKQSNVEVELTQGALQKHLDFLFGPGVGALFGSGLSTAADFQVFDGKLYSAIQIKSSQGGKTRLLTNILMRSSDQGVSWELLGAPDPRLLPGEIQILAEPAITADSRNIYLHLRSNVATTGYVLSKASKADLFHFDAPVPKWTYGIGRPAICNLGDSLGLLAMFTAPTVNMGPKTVTRNQCDVVRIDPTYSTYTRVAAIVDPDAINTPFLQREGEDVYVTYSTGRRHLIPKFGTSEIVFSKLPREFLRQPQ